MPSSKPKKAEPNIDHSDTRISEESLDAMINQLMFNMDAELMRSGLDNVASLIFTRGEFVDDDEKKKSKTAMIIKTSEKNNVDLPEVIILMIMFLFKKLGFKSDAVRTFLAQQIQAENPNAENVGDALDALLSSSFPL